MAEGRGNFRRKLFGGFDRTDVINYIETIAGQRNKYQTEAQKFAKESDELRTKLDSLTGQIQKKDTKLTATSKELDAARKELNDVWKELREVQDELEVVKGQLDRSNKELASKTSQYENDMAAAQASLNDAITKGEKQRIAAINSASQILADLRTKYNGTKNGVDSAAGTFRRELDTVTDNMSAMSTAFSDAENEFKKLLTNKEN